MITFKRQILIIILFSLGGFISFILFNWYVDCNRIETYTGLKNSLFTGFLTVGSFLLSLKTFILAKQSEILKSDWYSIFFEKYKYLFEGKLVDKFTPLENINNIVTATILSCFVTSILHLLIVFFGDMYFVALCFGLTVGTLSIVVRITFMMKGLTNNWISFLRKEEKEKDKKELSAKVEQ